MTQQLVPYSLELPTPDELRGLWERCLRVSSDGEVASWMQSLRIDPYCVDLLGLARVLPRDLDAPSWARYGTVSWQESGYRVLVPLYDARGKPRALYARSLRPLFWTSTVCSLPPVTGMTGIVMANATALRVLRGGAWPADNDWHTIVVAGGAADYLEWASSLLGDGPAIFGIVPGSWSRELAERIPIGTRVIVRAHANPITSRYAHRVQAALDGRCEVIVKTT